MEKICIRGGNPLRGTVEVSGMKNAALPIIFACVLVKDKCTIENVPDVRDVNISFQILSSMGAIVKRIRRNTYEIDCTNIRPGTSSYELAGKMRASYYLLGAELGRCGKAHTGLPGGCNFGVRPIDQHIKSFKLMGGIVNMEAGCVDIRTEAGVKGANIFYDKVSVGATINAMLAAVLADGTTTLDNPAKEPHIVDVANFLNTCGAKISGAGTDMIKIRGVRELHGCTYAIIPDMIEAGTFMLAAAATRGCVRINGLIPKHMESITAKLIEMGAEVKEFDDAIHVSANKRLVCTDVKTMPYPGFPTDMHPQMSVLLSIAEGVSIMKEGVYDTRFKYVDELTRMGAHIKVNGTAATIEGVERLSAAPVTAVDLRAGAAVVIAGLVADGVTEISEIGIIERGYDDIVSKLSDLGADIKKVYRPDGDDMAKAN